MTNDYGNLELHKVLLSAMKDIDKICREHGLRYYLYAGTLLGAMNHKGFIPWDDDVDIVMFPDDFNTLCEIISRDYADRYTMMTFESTPHWYSKMSKLQINGTSMTTSCGNNPIFIDISRLHSIPDSTILRTVQRKQIEWLNLCLSVLSGEVIPKSLKSKLSIGLYSRFGKHRLGQQLEHVLTRYDHQPTTNVGIMCNTLTRNPYTGVSGYDNDITMREWHTVPLYIPFEDTQFMTISHPEKDLTHRYGPAWSEPYPEEKRITKHDVKSYQIEDFVLSRIQEDK